MSGVYRVALSLGLASSRSRKKAVAGPQSDCGLLSIRRAHADLDASSRASSISVVNREVRRNSGWLCCVCWPTQSNSRIDVLRLGVLTVSPNSPMNRLVRHNRVLAIITCAVLGLGALVWVCSRFLPIDQLEGVGLVTLLAGTIGFAVLASANAHRLRRPWILQTMGIGAVLWGLSAIGFMFAPVLKYLAAILVMALLLILAIGWKDLTDPQLWRGKQANST